MGTVKALVIANNRRTQRACGRTVPAARAALAILRTLDWQELSTPVARQYFEVLQLRIDHPALTLGQLGALMGISKNAYSSLLRRGIAYGERKSDGRFTA